MRLGAAARETFDLADRHAASGDFTGDGEARLGIGDGQERARVTCGDAAFFEQILDRFFELEQADGVGDGGAVFPGSFGDLFLRQVKFVNQALESVRLLDGVKILALEVLYQRHFQRHFFRDVADDDRNAEQARALCCAPAAFAGD